LIFSLYVLCVADGYVRAEAVGALMLTIVLQSEDIAAGHTLANAGQCPASWHSLALLKGSAVNQDGRSSSLTAPNGPSQQEVVNAALKSASLGAWEVSHLQMHGTGTPLGDPIELGAATASLLPRGSDRLSPLHLTAAKAFMGHAEPAAGIVGVTRLAIILGHMSVDPMLTLRNVNPYVSAALAAAAHHGPMHRATAPRQLGPAPGSSASVLGGVSAFAFQGTNAHAVVQKIHSGVDAFSFPSASELIVRASSSNKVRFWVLPAAHPFAFTANVTSIMKYASPSAITFDASLMAPRLAYLRDHTVFGRVLFPAAGMLRLLWLLAILHLNQLPL